MPTLISPAAPAAAVISKSETMADIIDSLKRLERIGSESSKTVEKIISAAQELEAKIVELYRTAPGPNVFINSVVILSKVTAERKCTQNEAAGHLGLAPGARFNYRIYSGCLFHEPGDRVSLNRDTALHFAKDIADGLLSVIAADLSMQQRENEDALQTLERARLSATEKRS